MARIPLNALQTFVAAAQARNLTRTAERLHLTVSALSHQIRQLEEHVGCALFVRGPRGLKLTAEGDHLHEKVKLHLEAIADALQPMRTRAGNVLSLSAMPSMATSWLLPRLPAFVARHPEIELNLDSSIELVDFAGGRFDAALRYGTGSWPGLVVEPFLEEWLTPVASPRLLGKRPVPPLQRLGEWPLLGPAEAWQRWFSLHGGRPPKRFAASFSDSESRQRAAVEGIGVALGRTTMVRPLLEHGTLVALCKESMKAEAAHYLVYPERSRMQAGFVVFREWLLSEAERFRAQPTRRPTARATAGRKRSVPARGRGSGRIRSR